MNKERLLSIHNLKNFNYEETKKNVSHFFWNLENLKWEWMRLNAQKGMTVNYDFTEDCKKTPYVLIGKDMFAMSAKEDMEEQLKSYLSTYSWAKSILSEKEQIYIHEYFINRKRENEIVDLLDCICSESYEFRKIKKSAIYKFADFLSLVIRKDGGNNDERKIN